MKKSFWKDKKVLITGFEGFLGSHLTQALIFCGAKVTGLDVRVNRKDTILTPGDYKKITVINGSVADFKLLKGIIRGNKIDVVFHLAAEAIVGECHDNPLKAFSTNIEGTWNILEACRGIKRIQSLVIASSDKAYGCHKKLPYKEDAPLIGRHPYDVSKSCADLIAYTYSYTYGLPAAVTRCGNIYGPGDFNFSRIVPDTIRCALTGKTLFIRSDGKFTRDYVFVGDIVNGYMVIAEKMKQLKLAGEAFNFSDENPVSVLALVEKIYAISGEKEKLKVLNRSVYEIKHQYLSSVRARKILGWKPSHDLETGLRKTIAWYRDYLRRKY